MPAQTNTNVSPYYDDFDPESNFHRVLFKPGYPVQARELTQSQTILQDQIERLSSAFLKDGDNVIPGGFTYNNITPYVRCSSITQGATAQEFVGYKLRGVSSGVVAEVDFATEINDEDDVTFYVTYLSSGDSTTEQTFLEGEILESDTPNNYTATVGVNEVSKPIITPPLGFGSIFSVNEGYYYVNGFMVRNDAQTIAVDKYSIKPTVKVGFLVDEDFINSNEDPSLLDNSQGASNFAAPGADRLKISLILVKRDQDSFDPDFITLATIVDGSISGDPLRNNKYDWVNDLLAKRTFDESGDYIVTEFPIKPLEYVNSEYLDGVKDPNGDGSYPAPSFGTDSTLTFDQANALYAINVSPGNAYVQGYNVQFVNPFNIYGEKARDVKFIADTYTQINPGNLIDITNVSSTPDFANNRGTVDTNAFSPIICYRNFNDGFSGSSLTIGDSTTTPETERRPLNNGNAPWKTYHIITDTSVGKFDTDMQTSDGYYKVTIKHNVSDKTSDAILVYPDPSSISLDSTADISTIDIGNSIVVRLELDSSGNENDEPIVRGDEIGIVTTSGGTPTYNAKALISVPFQPLKTGLVFPKYLQNDKLVEGDTSVYGFNSTFKMGILDTYFFDDLLVVDDPLTEDADWEIGNFLLGETSRSGAKLEDNFNSSLVISNVLGKFKNGESVRQVLQGVAPNNTYLTYVPSLNTDSGLSGKQFSVANPTDVNNVYKFDVTYTSTDDLSQYISGGYVTRQVVSGGTVTNNNAKITAATYDDSNNKLTITIDRDLSLTAGNTVTISEMIFRATSLTMSPDVKRGTIVRRGEVAKFYFDDFIGNTNPPGQAPGGGSGADIFTADVNLINPMNRSMRLPPESGLTTQADANEWFYYSIKSLLAGEGSSQVFIDENEPAEKSFGDLWIDPRFYSMSVWDGMYWIDIVAGSENDEYNADPTNSTTTAVVADYLQEKIDADKLINVAKQALLARANDFDRPDPRQIPANYSLEKVTYVDVRAIGSTLRLHTIESSGVELGPNDQILPDIYFDSNNNSIELTKQGRDKIYKFPFFQSETFSTEIPRISYRLVTNPIDDGNGVSKSLFGYALTFPAVVQNNFKNVKSFFSESVDTDAQDFTADISTQSRNSTEIFTVANRSTFTGTAGRNYITCDNFDGDASQELVAGDLVTITNDNGIVENKIVFSATEPYGYGTTKTKSVIFFTTSLLAKVTSKQIQRVRIKSEGPMSEGGLIQLQEDVIKSLETDQNITNIDYEVYHQFVGQIDQGDQEIVIKTTASNEVIVTDTKKMSIFIADIATTSSLDKTQKSLIGRPLEFTIKENSLVPGGGQLTLKLKNKAEYDFKVKVIFAVEVTNAKARKKELVEDETITLKYDATQLFDPAKSPASQNALSLGKADVYRIKSVTTEDSNGNEIDIIDNYIFDDGQTEDIYRVSTLRRKPDSPIPTSDVKVVFDYFKHDSLVGGFFSVDSYTHSDGVPYDKIPSFTPRKTTIRRSNSTKNPPRRIELRDCVDFRPIMNTDPTTGSTVPLLDIKNTTDKLTNYLTTKVSGNAFVPQTPVPGTQFKCDIQKYLPKIDSLFLDKTGKVVLISGESSDNPVPPADLSTGIRLYDITIPAYTFDISQLSVKKYNYRRYTMKDIFELDKRVDQVENLVTLTLLESSALTTEVRDSVTGLGRFKNGVIVDAFRNHFKGNVGNSQYRCSIDPKETHLRPPYNLDQVELEEKYDTDDARLDLGGYVNHNGIVTLPYTETNFVTQEFATRYVNLQPYSVFTYEGKLTLDPPIDTFRDIKTLPQLVIEDNSIFDALVNQTNEINELNIGTVWSEWETTDSSRTIRNLGSIANTSQNRAELAITGPISFEGNSANASTIQLTESSESITESRTITRNLQNVSTASITNTSYGDRVTDLQLASTMRTIPVFFKAERLKPNTRYYAFFDAIDVSEWVSVDKMGSSKTFPDGKPRYNGVPNSNPGGFGLPIISDADGNISGVFLIPNGRSPVNGSKFDGNLLNVEYNTSGPTRSFFTGQRSFRLTTSSANTNDITQLEGFAQSEFISSGVLLDKQETIVSTRQPEVTTSVQITEDIRVNSTTTITGTFVPNPPPPQRPARRDPIAQTFYVDNNNDEGVFVSDLDVFFRTKDSVQGVEVYMVATEQGAPTSKIIPHSKVVKKSDSIIRVKCDLNGLNTATLEEGTTVVGTTSGAVGVIANNVKFESGNATDATPNINNTVYEVILSNYLNEFKPGESIVPQVSPPSQANFEIVEDELQIKRIDLKNMGTNYAQGAEIEFSAPDLPGGVRAEGVITVADVVSNPGGTDPYPEGRLGQIYKVQLTNAGSGYTKKPSVTVVKSSSSTGAGVEFDVRVNHGRSAVDMGVATSDDATAPTKFRFDAPVYLLSNQSYAFVVKCPTSLNYTVWISKLGENVVGTSKRVSQQPNLGCIFRSSNNDIWTEDQTEDIKFNLRRCEFNSSKQANVALQNVPLSLITLPNNPIQVSKALGSGQSDKAIFGYNHKVIRIFIPNNGLSPEDYIHISGVKGQLDSSNVENIGGIPVSDINGLHQIVESDLNYVTVLLNTSVTNADVTSINGGGKEVMSCVNRPYETINLYSGVITYKNTSVVAYNRPTNHAGITLYNEDNAYVINEENIIPVMDSYYYDGAKQVACDVNEIKYSSANYLNKGKSMRTRVTMKTDDSKLSPVLDITRTNMNIVRNQVDSPEIKSTLISDFITIPITFSSVIASEFSVGDIIDVGNNMSVQVTEFLEGNDFEITGPREAIKEYLKSGNALTRNSSTSTAVKYTSFPSLPETSPEGTTYAKWISKRFMLENSCDGIELKVSAILYDQKDIRAYYSTRTVGSQDDPAVSWTPFNQNETNEGHPDNVETISPRSTTNVDPRQINADEWQTIVWSVQDISKFDSISIKIVMTAENPAKTPVIDDLRLICTE